MNIPNRQFLNALINHFQDEARKYHDQYQKDKKNWHPRYGTGFHADDTMREYAENCDNIAQLLKRMLLKISTRGHTHRIAEEKIHLRHAFGPWGFKIDEK